MAFFDLLFYDPLTGELCLASQVGERPFCIRRNIPKNPFEWRNQISVLRVVGGYWPAEKESSTNNEPDDLHTEFHIRKNGYHETGCQEIEGGDGLLRVFPMIEAKASISARACIRHGGKSSLGKYFKHIGHVFQFCSQHSLIEMEMESQNKNYEYDTLELCLETPTGI